MMPRLGPPYPGDGGTAGQAVIKRAGLMWVLVVLAIKRTHGLFYPRHLKRADVFCQGEENHSDVAPHGDESDPRGHRAALGAGGRPDMNFTRYGFQIAA